MAQRSSTPPPAPIDRDRRWALNGAALLIITFVCPLIIGPSWIFGPTLLANSAPDIRMLALVPGLLGPVLLVVTLKAPGLIRAVLNTAGAGIGIIVYIGTLEASGESTASFLSAALAGGAAVIPGSGLLMLFTPLMAAAFVGLVLLRYPETEGFGIKLAGLAGAALCALHVAPLGGRTLIGVMSDSIAWNTAWPVPLAIVLSLLFSAACVALLFDHWPPDQVTQVAVALGLGAVLTIPVGMVAVMALEFFPMVGSTLTLMFKFYGAFLAMHLVLAGGVIGLVRHGRRQTAV